MNEKKNGRENVCLNKAKQLYNLYDFLNSCQRTKFEAKKCSLYV